jgi:hypothetical protein
MIELAERPKPQGVIAGLSVHLREDFKSELKDDDEFQAVVTEDMQHALVNATRWMPPGLMNTNLFFFNMQLHRSEGEVLVDIDIELRPFCDAEEEPVISSIVSLPVVAGDNVTDRVRDATMELYHSRVPARIVLNKR